MRFSVWELNQTDKNGETKYALTALQQTIFEVEADAESVSVSTNWLYLCAGEYYVSMESINAGSGGSAYYNVGIDVSFSDPAPESGLLA